VLVILSGLLSWQSNTTTLRFEGRAIVSTGLHAGMIAPSTTITDFLVGMVLKSSTSLLQELLKQKKSE
jgi:hypothetical protein